MCRSIGRSKSTINLAFLSTCSGYRYSVHESSDIGHSSGGGGGGASLMTTTRPQSSGRSTYKPSHATSRYSSIFEETGRGESLVGGSSSLLSPNSPRRNVSSALSDLTTARRESTFYGLPSSRDSSLSRRDHHHHHTASSASSSSSYYVRSTSSGLDYGGGGGGGGGGVSSQSTNYATMRPSSYLRHRR